MIKGICQGCVHAEDPGNVGGSPPVDEWICWKHRKEYRTAPAQCPDFLNKDAIAAGMDNVAAQAVPLNLRSPNLAAPIGTVPPPQPVRASSMAAMSAISVPGTNGTPAAAPPPAPAAPPAPPAPSRPEPAPAEPQHAAPMSPSEPSEEPTAPHTPSVVDEPLRLPHQDEAGHEPDFEDHGGGGGVGKTIGIALAILLIAGGAAYWFLFMNQEAPPEPQPYAPKKVEYAQPEPQASPAEAAVPAATPQAQATPPTGKPGAAEPAGAPGDKTPAAAKSDKIAIPGLYVVMTTHAKEKKIDKAVKKAAKKFKKFGGAAKVYIPEIKGLKAAEEFAVLVGPITGKDGQPDMAAAQKLLKKLQKKTPTSYGVMLSPGGGKIFEE